MLNTCTVLTSPGMTTGAPSTNRSTFCEVIKRLPAAASAAPYHAYHALFCHAYLHVDGKRSRRIVNRCEMLASNPTLKKQQKVNRLAAAVSDDSIFPFFEDGAEEEEEEEDACVCGVIVACQRSSQDRRPAATASMIGCILPPL